MQPDERTPTTQEHFRVLAEYELQRETLRQKLEAGSTLLRTSETTFVVDGKPWIAQMDLVTCQVYRIYTVDGLDLRAIDLLPAIEVSFYCDSPDDIHALLGNLSVAEMNSLRVERRVREDYPHAANLTIKLSHLSVEFFRRHLEREHKGQAMVGTLKVEGLPYEETKALALETVQ